MWVENISLKDIQTGNHFDAGENSILIQIVAPSVEFPTPRYKFKEVHRFIFEDLEEHDTFLPEELKITDAQAMDIAQILGDAMSNRSNIVVHCEAGLSRSGAIVDVAELMGFTAVDNPRIPNELVKRKVLEALLQLAYN